MFCVNVKSKEFKEACNRLNIHPSSLEVIVFQYLNNIDAESFPSDEYIMNKLEGKAMTNASESQILLWEKAYSTPKVFSDKASVGAFIKEASKYFSPNSISIHRNNEGQYVASVTRPENREEYEKELKRILDNAPRNKQGQLLAPNGKPTKLSERQYAQVRTKAFKKWFGDWTKITQNEDGTWNIPTDVSKIINEETGEPKVVFHGSNNTFTEFKTYHKDKEVGDMFGAYFTKNRKYAEKTYGKSVYEVFLNIKSPLNTEGRWTGIINEESYKEITTEHDGIINDNFDNTFLNKILRNSRSELIVFNSNQIKSATDNVGTFSTESNDIMYSYNPSSGGMTSFSTRERVKNHYLRTVSTSVERSIQTIEALQKVFSNIRISTADSNMSDANGFSAMEDAQKLAAQARLKYGNLAEVRVVEKRGYIELQITPKSKEELEKFYTNRVYEYIRNLSNEDILNELLTIESDYYDDLAYHIKAKDIPVVKEQIAKKNANITAQEIEEAIDFLVSLENNPETNLYVNTCIKWLKNGVIRLPQDNDAILAIFKMAREEGFDVQKLKHPFDVIRLKIEKNKKNIIPGKATNPREIPQFSYSKSIETEEGIIEVYDVEDSYEGQAAVCQALADASPKGEDGSWILGGFSSPWCLSTFNYDKNTGKATPTHGAVHTFWPRYDKGKRQIAFHNGMPVGFNSTDKIDYGNEWWDYWDSPKTYLDASNITSRNRINNEIQPISESLMKTNLGFANVYIDEGGEVYNISYNQGNYSFIFDYNQGHLPNIRVPFSIFSQSSSFNCHVSIFNSTGEIEIMYKRKRIHIAIPQSRTEEIRKLSKLLMSKHEEFKEIKKTLENKCKPFAERLLPMPSELLNEIMTFSEEAQGEIDDIVKKLKKESEIILNDVENYIIEEKRKKEEEARIVSPDIAEAVLESLEDLEEGYIEPREPMYVEPENRDTRVTPEEYATHTEEMDPIEENILNSTTEKINKKSKYRRFTPRILQRILQSIKDIDYKSSYNRHYQETVNQDLEAKLKDILEHYHFEVLETSMKEVFGDDILGATDFLNKVIYLAERGDRNAITGVEEFAHAFVKMMGSIYHKPENRERFPETKIYSEIRDEIGNTSLYQQVLERYSSDPQYQHEDGSPNLPKIKEEAIGQALATVLLDRYEAKNRKDKAFFDKIKQWFRDILTKFKAIFVNSAYLDKQLMSIADSILDGTYHKKFLQKVNDGNYKLQNYTETIENSVAEDEGLSLSIMQDAVACGGIITGSLSYRMQTPVYRDSADALHDIDIAFPLSRHLWHARHPFFRNPHTVRNDRMMSMDRILQEVETFDPIARFKERQPNTTLMYAYWGDKDILVVNAIISENEELKERFRNLTGNFTSRLEHFTEEERKQIRLVDFFFNPDNKIEEDVINDEVFNLKLANYKHSFRAKLKYGRAKDIYDYQTLNPVNRQYLIDRADVAERQLMWQKKPSTTTSVSTSWARTSENSYEVSTAGDRRFSAMVARFNPGTIIEGVDVGGMTIEQVYQSIIKKSRKGQPPAEDSMINRPIIESQLSEEARKDFYSINKEDWSYRVGYLPLWQEWAKQNPQLIEELRENSAGKTLTDKFANTRVSQARALAEILNSKTEEITETDPKTLEEKLMENNLKLIKEIENLYELGLSQLEVRHLGEQLMWWISDHLTVLQTTPGELERVYGIKEEDLKGKNISLLSRKEIAELVTPDRLMFQCMRAFTGRSGMTPRQALKIKKIANNFKALMYLSSSTFSEIEGFGLIEPGADFGIMSEIKFTPEDFNNENDFDTIVENEGDAQQHWQVNFRTLDVLDNMTPEVRLELLKCYQLDKKRNPIISEYGIKERINARQAVNTILRICQGRNDLPSMIKKMGENVNTYPWLQQIITRLEDESRQNDNFKSAFFTTFCKPFVSYSVTRKNKDGVYESIIVNEFPALREAVNSVTTKYKMNQHPMFNNEGVTDDFREVKKIYESLREAKFEELNLEELKNKLTYVYNALGYDITPDFIEPLLDEKTVKDIVTNLGYVVNSAEQGFFKLGSTYDPFKFRGDYNILTSVRNILRKVSEQLEDTSVASTYDNGKMYQSYVTQSYLSKLMSKFQEEDDAEFEKFIKEEYGNYEWFTNSDGTFRNSWLELLATDPKYRSIFKHKVQLNFNKKNYMRNMSKAEYVMSMITEYFSELDKDNNFSVAWYRVPMMSNKPSSEFIRFVSYNNVDYKTQITKKLFDVFLQEMSRIQTVEMRGLSKEDSNYIKNFDSNGKKFCFLDYFNEYLTGNKKRVDEKTGFELGKLIRKKLDGKKIPGTDKVLTTSEELVLKKLAIAEIEESMDARVDKILEEWKESGITDKCSSIKGVGTTEEVIEENLRKFIWNDTLAAINIIQLTVTDIAYYKDAEDLQKRFAQIHSPGVRANRHAKWNGESVSDGYVRTIYLKDFENVVSNVIDNISIVFDNKIKAAKELAITEGRNPDNDSEVKSLEALKESLVGENGLYRQINVTDAQGYSSATSYRKKAIMFGKWSETSEATYNKLMGGDFTATDLQVAFQPLKPFVYTQIPKSSGNSDAPMTKLKVPIQNKNSEYLLVLADAILQGQDTGKPNLLRAINEVMEESAKRNPRSGIDTVQFTSAVKSGLCGAIDITKASTVEEAKEIMNAAIYSGSNNSTLYSEDAVDAIPVEDYCIQQEVPAHFRDHEQAHGSQTRAIVIADLLDFYPNGEEVIYKYKEGSVEKSANREDFIKDYEETIAENIQDSIDKLSAELHIDVGTDRKSRNLALSKILQREILSNPSRYGTDLLIACSVNEDGEFRIPLGDPIQSKRVEQLINSIIKNRINKQTLPGGPVVQVSNFGTSRQLSIVFNGKDGKPLRKIKKGESDAEYKKYIEENQAGIAYLECFAPAYTRDLFSKFINEDGNLDVEAIEATDPDLLKMVGYRIPTEDKYSISPLKIVGFLPREAGDGIMLPYDITLLNGSDFDIDKMYVMFKDLKVRKKKFDKKNETSTLFKGVQNKIYQALLDSRGNNGYNQEEVTKDAVKLAAIFLNKKIKVEEKRVAIAEIESKYSEKWGTKIKDLYKAASRGYRASRYESVQPTNDRALRNNKIVDMTYAVMTHETTVDKMLNPGGFDQQKAMGYKVAAFNVLAAEVTDESTLLKIWEDLSSKSIDDLKDLASKDKNLCFIDTHTQFYDQNNAAGALIGIFAVHKVAHAFLGNDGFIYRGEFAPFTIAGNTISPGIPIDPEKDFRGQYVGKVLGSLVASAADAVKDPILNLMNINSETAITLCTMVRLGIPFDTAAMFLSQKVIGDILREKANKNIDGYTSLSEIIKNKLADLEKTHGISSDSSINTGELTMEELIVGIKGGNPAIEYKVLTTLATIMNINNDMRGLSYLTRFNSISNAVGPLIIDNLLMEEKLANFPDTIYSQEGVKLNAIDVLRRHPILNKFHETISIAHHLFGEMPTNSDNFRDILRNIPGSLRETILRDRKLLSSISDFYQSYMLINSGTVDYSKLSYYINDFPKEYIKIITENPELKSNALIQAIRLAVDDKSGKPILKIDTTGIERDYKESLSSGWADLIKTNKELALHLFYYNFFKGGIVFNPKTFMGLAPNKVKENIDGYVETYRNSPALDPVHFLDLFIRNNWSEYKLVPRLDISLKTSDIKSGKVSFTKIEDIEAIGDKRYFRVKLGKSDLLLRISYVSDSEIKADVVSPLGNNKEYLEMSTEEITKAMVETKEAIEDDSPSTIDDTRKESSEGVYEEGFIVTKDRKYTMEEYMELLVGKDKVSRGLQKISSLSTEDFFDTTVNQLAEISKARGVEVSIESIAKIFKKLC